jgi:hypothetical protein
MHSCAGGTSDGRIPAAAFELPNPSEPDLTDFFALSSRMSTLPDVARQTLAEFRLPPELERRVSELHADASRIASEQTADEAVPTLEQLDAAL